MGQTFLHGTETIEIPNGPKPVVAVKTAVIGLVGIAPKGPKNIPILVQDDIAAAQFGSEIPGFDIPQSLSHIQQQGAGLIIVVNVFDEALHTQAIVNEPQTVLNGKLKLANAPVGSSPVVVDKADNTASGYVLGTDYNLDEFGNFVVINGRIADNTILHFSYSALSAASVTTAQLIGTTDASGNRTGMQAWDLCYNMFGFRPKILIAPGKSAIKAIANALEVAAEKFKAVTVIDSIYGAKVSDAIAGRGDATTAFGTSNKRSIPVYPYLKAYDINKDDGNPETNTNSDFPASGFVAGIIAATDLKFGYWYSPSNKNYKGVTGIERAISANLSDANTDANLLNAVGIMTVFNSFGTGFRSWGNRNASFPTNTGVDSFISLTRTFDMVHESLEQAAIEFSDRPINQALIDDIRQSGNNFVKTLIGRGALTEGSQVIFDKAKNPPSQLALGQVKFTIIKMGYTPAELISYDSLIDISLLSTLK